MDSRGNILEVDTKEMKTTNVETGEVLPLSQQRLLELKEIDEVSYEKVIQMNRAERRKWFKQNNKTFRLKQELHNATKVNDQKEDETGSQEAGAQETEGPS